MDRNTKDRNKILKSLAVLAMMGAVIGGGTYATFNAETRNPGNSWTSGTLVLSNTVDSGTACLSTGAGTSTDTNVNANCDAIFDQTLRKPGDSASAALTLTNEGSLAGTLKLLGGTCIDSDASGETYHGSGSPCGKVQLYVQQTDSGGNPTSCLYGVTGDPNTCDFDASGAAAKTLADFASSSAGHDLGSLATGASRYFTVAVKLPSDADNTFQGRRAAIDFTWTLTQ